jgi:hypothetical protein
MAKNNNISNAADTLKQSVSAYAQQNPGAPLIQQLPNFSSMSGNSAQSWLRDKISTVDQSEKSASSLDKDTYNASAKSKQFLSDTRRVLQENEKLLKVAQASLTIEQRKQKIETQQVKDARAQVDASRAQVNVAQNLHNVDKQRANDARSAANSRKAEYDNVKHSATSLSNHLDHLDKKRQNSLSSHILQNRSLSHGVRSWGANKIAEEGVGGSIGGLAAGGAAVAGVAIVALIGEAIMKNVHDSIRGSDIYKGTGESVSSRTFIDYGINRSLKDGLGLSPDEGLNELTALRSNAGSLISNYGGAVTATAGLDRMTGSAIGTFGSAYSSLVRNSQMDTSANGSKNFSIDVASELGRGRLVGLSEETVRGVQQLVELTRRGTLDGSNPEKFLNLISTMSSSGHKELMGGNAAEVLGNFDGAIKNPNNPYMQVMVMQAVSRGMKEHGMKDYDNPLAIQNTMSQGIGATDESGKQWGQELPHSILEQIKQAGGDEAYQANLFMQSVPGTGLGTAKFLLRHPDAIDPTSSTSLISKYGLNADKISTPGGLAFAQRLAEADDNHKDDRGAAIREAVTATQKSWGVDTQASKELSGILNGKGSYDDKIQQLTQKISEGGVTPQDVLRVSENAFESKLESWMGTIVDDLGKIAQAAMKYLGIQPDKAPLTEGDTNALPYSVDNDHNGTGHESNNTNLQRDWNKDHQRSKNEGFSTYKDKIKAAAIAAGLDPGLYAAQIEDESGFQSNARRMENDGSYSVGISQINSKVAHNKGHDFAGALKDNVNSKDTDWLLATGANQLSALLGKYKEDPNSISNIRRSLYSYHGASSVTNNVSDFSKPVEFSDAIYRSLIKQKYTTKQIDEYKTMMQNVEKTIARKEYYDKQYGTNPPQTSNEANNSGPTNGKIETTHHVIVTDPNGNKTKTTQTASIAPSGFSNVKPKPIYSYISAKPLS